MPYDSEQVLDFLGLRGPIFSDTDDEIVLDSKADTLVLQTTQVYRNCPLARSCAPLHFLLDIDNPTP